MNRYILLLATLLTATPFAAHTQKIDNPIVDYREWQSPIRHQQDRGTCTAFAVVAAMETFSGTPTDLSEQYIYAEAKMKNHDKFFAYDEGAPLSFYLDGLKYSGTISEAEMPYNPNEPIWAKNASSFEAMKADIQANLIDLLQLQDYTWKLDGEAIENIQGPAAGNVAYIKSQLDAGIRAIPVGYDLSGNYWFPHPASQDQMIDPNDFLAVVIGENIYNYADAKAQYPGLAFNAKIRSGEIISGFPDTNMVASEGHAVAIVGYDDRGFLIKNSWGTDWGQDGYGWVSFDYHEIFCSELLIIRALQFAPSAAIRNQNWEPRAYDLKVLPHYYHSDALNFTQDGAELSLVWTGQARPVPLKEVTYTIQDQQGKTIEENYGYVQGIFAGQGTKMGYPANVLDGKIGPQSGPYTITVTATSIDNRTFTQRYKISSRQNTCYKPL